MKIFEKNWKRWLLGSRLRLLTARMADDADKIYEIYKNDFSAKWLPAFYTLVEEGPPDYYRNCRIYRPLPAFRN